MKLINKIIPNLNKLKFIKAFLYLFGGAEKKSKKIATILNKKLFSYIYKNKIFCKIYA